MNKYILLTKRTADILPVRPSGLELPVRIERCEAVRTEKIEGRYSRDLLHDVIKNRAVEILEIRP